ncbi:hypothetical protein, partial [Acinetobacter schindleri]|uniref:hypothetical protein n=1 Tax=Acinetobacter schindleri TaxID=108981 RepID=UPI002810DDE7
WFEIQFNRWNLQLGTEQKMIYERGLLQNKPLEIGLCNETHSNSWLPKFASHDRSKKFRW